MFTYALASLLDSEADCNGRFADSGFIGILIETIKAPAVRSATRTNARLSFSLHCSGRAVLWGSGLRSVRDTRQRGYFQVSSSFLRGRPRGRSELDRFQRRQLCRGRTIIRYKSKKLQSLHAIFSLKSQRERERQVLLNKVGADHRARELGRLSISFVWRAFLRYSSYRCHASCLFGFDALASVKKCVRCK